MHIDYLDKFKGSLIGVAIGDTLGHPFEGMLRDAIKSNFTNFKDFINDNKKLYNNYTYDTQLTIHTAQTLIQGRGFNLYSSLKGVINAVMVFLNFSKLNIFNYQTQFSI